MLKKIVLLLLLVALIALIYLLSVDRHPKVLRDTEQRIEKIPTLDISKVSIHFSIKKRPNGQMEFVGTFAQKETPMMLAENFSQENLEYRINIDSALLEEKELIVLTEKLLKLFVESYHEGEITFKQRKLLISGKVDDQNIIDKVESLLSYSTVNSFNNTELISKTVEIASELNALLLEDTAHQKVSGSDMNDTLTQLRSIADNLPLQEKPLPKKFKSEPIPKPSPTKVSPMTAEKPKVVDGKVKESRLHKPPRESKKSAEYKFSKPLEEKRAGSVKTEKNDLKGLSEAEAYRRQLAESMPDEDIMSLPSVETVDMNIEEKISRGEIKAEMTKKPLVEKPTIHIPASDDQKLDNEIPFANLYDIEEKIQGIVVEEVVASPIQSE